MIAAFSSVRPTRIFVVCLSGLFCLLTAATTIEIVRLSSSALPYWDSFGLYPVSDLFSTLWMRHNEHLIGTTRLFFKIDGYLGRYNGTFVLGAIFASLAGGAALLADQVVRSLKVDEGGAYLRLFVIFVFVTLATSAVQFTNLVWQFQIGFVGAFVYALTALLICSYSLQPWSIKAVLLTVLACAVASLASYGLFSGSLVWPFLILMALHRKFYLRGVFIGVVGLLVCFPYLSTHAAKLGTVSTIIPFALVFLGSPFGAISETGYLKIVHLPASVPVLISLAGGLILFFLAAALVLLSLREIRRASLNSHEQALTSACIALCGIVLISALLVGAGRGGRFPLQEAMSSRYTTPIIFMLCAVASLWIWLSSRGILPRRGIVPALLAAQVIVLLGQPQRLRQAELHAGKILQGEAAVFNQVEDPLELAFIFPDPRRIFPVLRQIRASRISLFAGESLNADLGDNISAWDKSTAVCAVALQRGPRVQDAALAWVQDRWRWRANVTARPKGTDAWQLRAVSDNIVVGLGAPSSRALWRFSHRPTEPMTIYAPASSNFVLVHPVEHRYSECGSNLQ